MNKSYYLAGALAATAAFAAVAPANAAVFPCSGGSLDLTVNQCVASGNDDLASVEAAIAAATGVTVASLALSLYDKSDSAPVLTTFPPDGIPTNGTSTDWSIINGTLIKYVTVKGGNFFKIYELPGAGANSGVAFSTVGITVGAGNTPDISHMSFWTVPGGAVPEPATWAMMLAGFAMIGSAMRRRRITLSYA